MKSRFIVQKPKQSSNEKDEVFIVYPARDKVEVDLQYPYKEWEGATSGDLMNEIFANFQNKEKQYLKILNEDTFFNLGSNNEPLDDIHFDERFLNRIKSGGGMIQFCEIDLSSRGKRGLKIPTIRIDKATFIKSDSLQLVWENPFVQYNDVKYEVEMKIGRRKLGEWTSTESFSILSASSVVQMKIFDLQPATIYVFRVRAKRADVTTDWAETENYNIIRTLEDTSISSSTSITTTSSSNSNGNVNSNNKDKDKINVNDNGKNVNVIDTTTSSSSSSIITTTSTSTSTTSNKRLINPSNPTHKRLPQSNVISTPPIPSVIRSPSHPLQSQSQSRLSSNKSSNVTTPSQSTKSSKYISSQPQPLPVPLRCTPTPTLPQSKQSKSKSLTNTSHVPIDKSTSSTSTMKRKLEGKDSNTSSSSKRSSRIVLSKSESSASESDVEDKDYVEVDVNKKKSIRICDKIYISVDGNGNGNGNGNNRSSRNRNSCSSRKCSVNAANMGRNMGGVKLEANYNDNDDNDNSSGTNSGTHNSKSNSKRRHSSTSASSSIVVKSHPITPLPRPQSSLQLSSVHRPTPTRTTSESTTSTTSSSMSMPSMNMSMSSTPSDTVTVPTTTTTIPTATLVNPTPTPVSISKPVSIPLSGDVIDLCVLCMDCKPDLVVISCGHLSLCSSCYSSPKYRRRETCISCSCTIDDIVQISSADAHADNSCKFMVSPNCTGQRACLQLPCKCYRGCKECVETMKVCPHHFRRIESVFDVKDAAYSVTIQG